MPPCCPRAPWTPSSSPMSTSTISLLAHEEGALEALSAKLGVAPVELEPAARLRDLFDRALAAARFRAILARVTHDRQAKDRYPAAMWTELAAAVRASGASRMSSRRARAISWGSRHRRRRRPGLRAGGVPAPAGAGEGRPPSSGTVPTRPRRPVPSRAAPAVRLADRELCDLSAVLVHLIARPPPVA